MYDYYLMNKINIKRPKYLDRKFYINYEPYERVQKGY